MESAASVPLWASVHLTHAVLQDAATAADCDILHIKGPAYASGIRRAPKDSSDADVLVRPQHLDRFLGALRDRGWEELTGFDDGSPFEHAANYRHPRLAYADVHRRLPGPHADEAAVFERLWRDRQPVTIAHVRCQSPSRTGQVFVQALHAARSHGAEKSDAWELADPAERERVRALAAELDARVALAAAIGELDGHIGARDHDLWAYWSTPETGRLDEWRGKWRAAQTLRERLHVATAFARVNRTHLRMRLGHEPSAAEVRAEQWARMRRLVADVSRRGTPAS